MVQYQRVQPPTRQQLYTAVQVYLIRKILNQIREAGCLGCKDPPEANQLGHMISSGLGCLDNSTEIGDSLYDKSKHIVSPMEITDLFHTVSSAIKISNNSNAEIQDSIAMAARVKLAVLSDRWEGSDLEELCSRVHSWEVTALQTPTMV